MMYSQKFLLSALSAGALLGATLPVVLAQTNAGACAGFTGQDRARCERMKPHGQRDERSASGSTMSKPHEAKALNASGSMRGDTCRSAHRTFIMKKIADHKAWHLGHRNGSGSFAADHKAWHKASNAAHKALQLELKIKCDKTATGSAVSSAS